MRPAEGTRLFFVEDQGVLFDETAQRLYHLNTTSAYIWCLLEEGRTRAEMTAALTDTFSLSPAAAGRYLEQALGLLDGFGVLDGPRRRSEPEAAPDLPQPVEYSDERFVAERRYRLLSSAIRMRFSRVEQLHRVAPVLDHLIDPENGAPTTTIDVLDGEAGQLVLCRERVPLRQCPDLEGLAPQAKGLVWSTAVYEHHFFLDLHAGVVGDGELAYLLPARSGSGKSTLTAALIHAGFEYFSDEVALLDEDMRVTPVPLGLCVKDTGIEVLEPYVPGLTELAEHDRADGKRVRYVPPPPRAVPPTDTRRAVGALIFPRYRPGAVTRCERLDGISALDRFLAECVVADTRLDADKVERLLAWLEGSASYSMEYSGLNEAVEQIRRLAGRD